MNLINNIIYRPFAITLVPIYYSALEVLHLTCENIKPISKSIFLGITIFATASGLGYHQLALWCLKWIGLGVMSSIGFGFGMHTFVLFLAPHIVAVTLASDSCQSLDFPAPPYPDSIICPESITGEEVTFLKILQKVSLESFMWGLGTAIGELPPYLAARVKGQAIGRAASGDVSGSTSQAAGWEVWMIRIINKIGFMGILLCAAIPNPLFDAAGVASGIAQVPFLTFFGATFIGKAIIKVLIQSSFVILIFHNKKLDLLVAALDEKLTTSLNLKGLLDEQRNNFISGKMLDGQSSKINTVISALMVLFVISVINTLSQQYKDRKTKSPTRKQ